MKTSPRRVCRELLARLKERGYTLALASSKPEKLCLSICERFGFTQSLQTIVGSPIGADWQKADVIREVMRRLGLTEADKPSMLMVGDRKYDVLGAAECGLPCVGVEFFGYAAPGRVGAGWRRSGGSHSGRAGDLYSDALSGLLRPT